MLGSKSTIAPLPALPAGAERLSYASEGAKPLKSWLLLAALALLFADIIAVIVLQRGGFGLRRTPRRAVAASLLAALGIGIGALCLLAPPASAQTAPAPAPPTDSARSTQAADQRAIEATSKVTLGYVLTGDPNIDETSRLGLDGLGRLLAVRTAVEPGRPMGVNILTDEIAFYPVLYWPVLPNAEPLPEPTLAKIDAYMKQGGLIVFDTQDFGRGVSAGGSLSGQGEAALQRILGRLDVPRLEPVPENHVLTKAFYLLRNFPGRWDGGQLWVEAVDGGGQDQARARPRLRRRHLDHRHAQRSGGRLGAR